MFLFTRKWSTIFITFFFISFVNAMDRKKETPLTPEDIERKNAIKENTNSIKFHCCGTIEDSHPFYKVIKRLGSIASFSNAHSPKQKYKATLSSHPAGGIYLSDENDTFSAFFFGAPHVVIWNPQNDHEFWISYASRIYQYEVQDPRVKCTYEKLDGRFQYVAQNQPSPSDDKALKVLQEQVEQKELLDATYRIKMARFLAKGNAQEHEIRAFLSASDPAIQAKVDNLLQSDDHLVAMPLLDSCATQ